ncbi:MAG: hypothetical protein WBZ20_09255 [Nitrososphaeraceae archaeon]
MQLGSFGFDKTVYGNYKKKKGRKWYEELREDILEMFDTADNAYSIDKKIYYSIVRSMVIQSLEKIVREDLNRHIGSINLHETIDIQEDEDIIADTSNNLFDYQDDDTKLSA